MTTVAEQRPPMDELGIEENFFRLLVDAVQDYAIFALDPNGRVMTWNIGAQRVNGYSASEIIGSHFSRFYMPEDIARQHPQEELKLARLYGKYEEEGWRLRKDGSRFWAGVVITAIRDGTGKLVGFTKVTRDLTERRLAEEELRRSRDELELRVHERTRELSRVLEAHKFLSNASAVLNASLNYDQTLKELAKLANTTLSDWCSIEVGMNGSKPRVMALAHPNAWRQELIEELQDRFRPNANSDLGVPYVIRTGKSEYYPEIPDDLLLKVAVNEEHLRILRRLGMKSAMIVPILSRGKVMGAITLISSESGRIYARHDLEVAEELGRRAGMAIENALLFEQAQTAVKMRDEFMSIASHELKTPLTSLYLQAQIRTRNFERNGLAGFTHEQFKKMVENDEKQMEQLVKLVEDMLDISRLRAGKFNLFPERMDLRALVTEVVDKFTPQLESAKTSVSIDSAGPVVGEWDRYRIEQVFTNLLSNALKYGAGRPIQVSILREGNRAELVVHDQGIGIAKDDQKRIFKQFERAVSVEKISGMGLGLYIVKQLVEAHGGSVRVESEPGKGASFTVELPLEREGQ